MSINIRRHGGGGSHYTGPRCPDLDESEAPKRRGLERPLQESYKNTSFNYRRQWKLLPGWHDPPDCLKHLAEDIDSTPDHTMPEASCDDLAA